MPIIVRLHKSKAEGFGPVGECQLPHHDTAPDVVGWGERVFVRVPVTTALPAPPGTPPIHHYAECVAVELPEKAVGPFTRFDPEADPPEKRG